MIANILGREGVRVTVIEKLEQIIDYPRAIGLDDEALRVFQSVDLAGELLPHITPDHWMRFVTKDGHCFASIEPRTDEFGWSRRNAFIQPLADCVLYEGLKRFDGVQVLLGHAVDAFTQSILKDATQSRCASRLVFLFFLLLSPAPLVSARSHQPPTPPAHTSVFAMRARALVQLKKPNAAIASATKALELNPDSYLAFKWRGKAYAQLGKWCVRGWVRA